MTPEQAAFDHIYRVVRKTENFVPKNYKSIGGMWSIDTWKKNGVTVQMMDEGYTSVIQNDKFHVVRKYNAITKTDDLVYHRGDSNDLIDAAFGFGLK